MEISSLVRLLGDMLGEVIVAQESQPVFETEEHFRFLAKARREGDANAALELPKEARQLENRQLYSVAGAFALYFDLVNIAEEVNRVNVLRARRSHEYPQPINNSIGAALQTMQANGVGAQELGAALENLRIELVLTSHPTQSKRRTVLAKINHIRQLADRLWQTNTTPQEKEEIQRDLRAAITTLWLTDRARTRRPEATDEVRTGLYFVDNVFWQVLPRIYRDLEEALPQHYPGIQIQRPWLTLASWVGGDRDGNPNVTHQTTAETLRLHRGLAVEKHGDSLRRLSRELSLSDRRIAVPAALETWFAKRRAGLPERVAFLAERYEHEPYRLALALLAADLQAASQENMASHLLDDQPHAARSHLQELLEVVETINASVPEAVRQSELHDLRIQLAAFGLQAARLDLREDARRINAVLAEILRSMELCPNFQDLEPSARAELLGDLLSQPARQLNPETQLSAQSAETWALFKLMARAKSIYGPELFGPFIISMAREAADVLAVLLLAYWAGGEDDLTITPLFETLDDLEHCPDVLTRLFKDPAYAAHLQRLSNEQMVMIGYSDSNKDGGYLAAQWAVYRAQERITTVCEQNGVKLTLFHGRGGSIARGGGPANRAIQAQPPGSIRGRFRVTEQGETIAFRYGDAELAYRNLEQIVHAVLVASLPRKDQRPISAEWQSVMDSMAAASLQTFRGLIGQAGFIPFWQEVTPLEEITRLHLSSRPASRGAGLALENLRAIPWVFSWMQSRFNLPGWFGLGRGLQAAPSLEALQEMYAHWPFFRAVLDNAEVSMLKADMGIAELYLSLASDVPNANRLFALIRAEYDLSVEQVLRVKKQQHLLEDDPLIQRTIQLRNPYVDPLNYLQVEVLRRLRALPDAESDEKDNLRATMIQTINGIAAGLRNTG